MLVILSVVTATTIYLGMESPHMKHEQNDFLAQ